MKVWKVIERLLCLLCAGFVLPSWVCSGCPSWYDANRFHAHTRLSITGFCSVDTKECKPVFENAADLFNELGVKAFVRHTKTAGEGTWWRSKSGPPASWHPFVQLTNRDLPKEFADKAHHNGQRVIFYHYPRASDYFGKVDNGSWLNRDPLGQPVKGPRGLGMCVNSPWRQVYKEQLLELVDFGADGLFFDEIPQPTEGCWCKWCREKFRAWSGEDRFPKRVNISDPLYLKLLEFNTQSVVEHYSEINRAIANRSTDVVTIVSLYKVPCADDGGDIYESTLLVNSTDEMAAKTEFTLSDRGTCVVEFAKGAALAGDDFEDGVMIAWGWALSRDAASGRPAHIWAPFLSQRPNGSAPAAVFAMAAYGAVANPDHAEGKIPNFELFNETYAMASALNPILNASRPARWVGVLFSERARNVFLPQDEVGAWKTVLFPTVSTWEILVKHHAPAGILTDWQVDSSPTSPAEDVANNLFSAGYKALLIPVAPDRVSEAQVKTIDSFQKLGGVVIWLEQSAGWADAVKRESLENSLWRNLTNAVGLPPVQLITESMHAVAEDWFEIPSVLENAETTPKESTPRHKLWLRTVLRKFRKSTYEVIGKTVRRDKQFHIEGRAKTMASINSFPHAVPLLQNATDTHLVVMITNDFTWIYGKDSHRPPSLDGLALQLNNVSASSLNATDVLGGRTLAAVRTGTSWKISLPTLTQFMAVQVICSEPCWIHTG